ncbi:EamA family transporter [Bowmanella sp. Y26]|uniref:DMT family transporter n=1 Tax=Bowmanella yangjiangensis TaxID=2811230 RepID=UPI001BDD5648|nr:EamA family transporter [Bowmanella yangjiangensis]
MDPVKKSLWSLHLAVILLGATALFSRIIPLSALDITLGRAVIAFVVLALLVRLSGGNLRFQRTRDIGIAIVLGGLMAVHWVTYFAAMQYSSVSVGMIALFTFPVITVLLEPFFEGIKLVWQDLVSAVVVLAGIWLIVPEASLGNEVTLGIAVGVFSALLYALRNLLHRKYFSHYGGAQAMTYQTLVIVLCLCWFGSAELYQASQHTYLMLLILGTICTAAPHALVAYTLIHLRAKTFSLVACMQPLYGVVLAILVLNEQPSWQTLVGGIMVISAAIYETINANKLHPGKGHS